MITIKTNYEKASLILNLFTLGIDGNKTLKEINVVMKAVRKFNDTVIFNFQKDAQQKQEKMFESIKKFQPKDKDSSAEICKKQDLEKEERSKFKKYIDQKIKEETTIELTEEQLRELKDVLENIKPGQITEIDDSQNMSLKKYKSLAMILINEICEDIEKLCPKSKIVEEAEKCIKK